MNILCAGGGTLGSVMPLLAVKDECARQNISARFFWVGTKDGVEKEMIQSEAIPFYAIPTAKLRRYWSLKNVIDVFKLGFAFIESIRIVRKVKPDLILTAGGFVGVPVVWAGKLFGAKVIIHQQDIVPSLSNKLTAFAADAITVTFERSLGDFPTEKTHYTGNPVQIDRGEGDVLKASELFGLDLALPTVFVLGGGTGASVLNALVEHALPYLVEFCQVLHVTGGRITPKGQKNYVPVALLSREQMKHAYAVSEIVISRAGLSTITELSFLGLPVIFVPMQDTHQEVNTAYIKEQHAGIVRDERELTPAQLAKLVKALLDDAQKRMQLSAHMKKLMKPDANEAFVKVIRTLMGADHFHSEEF